MIGQNARAALPGSQKGIARSVSPVVILDETQRPCRLFRDALEKVKGNER